MNKAVLVGRIAKTPELKGTTSSVSVCSFTVACDRKYAQNGERQTDFINCVAWRQLAEFIAKHFKKGDRIALEGSIQIRSWDDVQGNKRYATEVIVEHAEFAQSKGESASAQTYNASTPPIAPNADTGGFTPLVDDFSEEDFPF